MCAPCGYAMIRNRLPAAHALRLVCNTLGCRQAVRHRTLTPAFEGSNPSSSVKPSKQAALRCGYWVCFLWFIFIPASKAQKKATAKLAASAYDRTELKVQKGKKDAIKAQAAQYQKQTGEIGKVSYCPAGSLQGFINRAINETLERDKGGSA